MKKSVVVLIAFALILGSCGEKKKEEVKEINKETEKPTEAKKSDTMSPKDYVVLGEKLFTEKTCTTCHQIDTKVIGPSIKDIMKVYRDKNGNIVDFLKSKSEPIVDTDPGQVAIMKANIEGFVKDLTDTELAALAAYMSSIK